jgi:hypothetical protein
MDRTSRLLPPLVPPVLIKSEIQNMSLPTETRGPAPAFLVGFHLPTLFGNTTSPCESCYDDQVESDYFPSDVTSDTSVIVLNIYDRFVDENSSGFLGMLEIKPVLIHDHSVDNWYP